MHVLRSSSTSYWIWIALVLLVLLTRGPRLLAVGANQLAVLALLPEWKEIGQAIDVPRCTTRVETSAANAYLQAALSWDPAYPRALVNAGRAAWLEGDCAAAAASWQRALVSSPRDTVAAFWLYWARDVDAVHADDLSGALSAAALARYAYLSGEQARRAGLMAVAAAWYERSLSLWEQVADALPDEDAERWWAAAQVAELAQDWEAALKAYARGVQVADTPSIFYMKMGHIERMRGQYEAALVWYRQAYVVGADLWEAKYYQGVTYYLKGDYDQARALFLEGGTRNPNNPYMWYYLGRCEYQLGAIPEAVEQLTRAIALCHRETTCGNQVWKWGWEQLLGDWYFQIGRCEDAIDLYEHVLLWQPGELTTMERLNAARNCLKDEQQGR